jgi:hypothetical protein
MTDTPIGAIFDRVLLQQILAEIGDAFQNTAAVEDFYRQVGQRLGRLTSLGAADTLAEIQDEMNAIWAAFEIGQVKLMFGLNGLTLVHAFPKSGLMLTEVTPKHLMRPLLEGWYGSWLGALSSGRKLHTRCKRFDQNELEFWHGP